MILFKLFRNGEGNYTTGAQSSDGVGAVGLPPAHLLHAVFRHVGNGCVRKGNLRQASRKNSIHCVLRRHATGEVEIWKDLT
jgi:hypothetical protein